MGLPRVVGCPYAPDVTTDSPHEGRLLLLVLVAASVGCGAVVFALVGVLRDVLRIACHFVADGEATGWTCADGAPYGLLALAIGTVLWTFLVAGAVGLWSSRRRTGGTRPGHSLRAGSLLVAATSGAVLVLFGIVLGLQAVDVAGACGGTAPSAIPVSSCAPKDVPVGAIVWTVMPVWVLLLIAETAGASLLRPASAPTA